MTHTLEEEASQRGQHSSGHRPVLKDFLCDYCIDMSRGEEKRIFTRLVKLFSWYWYGLLRALRAEQETT